MFTDLKSAFFGKPAVEKKEEIVKIRDDMKSYLSAEKIEEM
jgi:hypothetical protein